LGFSIIERITSVQHPECKTGQYGLDRPIDLAVGVVTFESTIVANMIVRIMMAIVMLLNIEVFEVCLDNVALLVHVVLLFHCGHIGQLYQGPAVQFLDGI
jgi:hypothetical protein